MTCLLAPFDEVEEEKLYVYNSIQCTNDQVTEHSSTHSTFLKCPTFEDEQKNTNLNSRRKFARMILSKFIDDAVQYSTKDSGKGGKRNYAILENMGCQANT